MADGPTETVQRTFWARQTLRKFLFLGLIGSVPYAGDLGVFSALVLLTGLPIASNLISRAVGAACGYYLNGFLTFRALGRQHRGFDGQFVLSWLIMTCLSTTLVKAASLPSFVSERLVLLVCAKAAIELLLLAVGFLVCKLQVFVPRKPGGLGNDRRPRPTRIAAGEQRSPGPDGGMLFLLAHFDDEFFFAPVIEDAVRAGRPVYCLYTTDGQGYGVPSEVRMRESIRALANLGVPESGLLFAGVQSGIADRMSHRCLPDVYRAVREAVSGLDIAEIYVLAWEGGHIDHDATHLVAVALAHDLGVHRLFECPAYTAYGAGILPFRVMRWIPRPAEIVTRRPGLSAAWRCFALCLHYHSQWKTFLGLAPGAFVGFVLFRRHQCRVVSGIDYTVRPHLGPLFYEKRFGVSFEEFSAATAGFVARCMKRQSNPASTSSGSSL